MWDIFGLELTEDQNLQIAKEVFEEERVRLMKIINQLKGERRFYVYTLCFEDGVPFYVGKGSKKRAYDHLMPFWYNKDDSLKNRVIREIINTKSPPIVDIVEKNLTEIEAYELEMKMIQKFGRFSDGGILCNISKGGVFEVDDDVRRAVGVIAGTICYETRSGIHGASKEDRVKWAKIGSKALSQYGKRGGCCTKEWHEQNKDRHKEISSNAGKIGGKARKGWVYWNNGKKMIMQEEWPGEGWVRGHLNISENSIANLRKPNWTNGFINRKSEEKPGNGFFRGLRRNRKDGRVCISISLTNDEKELPSWLKLGKNYFTQEELEDHGTS